MPQRAIESLNYSNKKSGLGQGTFSIGQKKSPFSCRFPRGPVDLPHHAPSTEISRKQALLRKIKGGRDCIR